jgi:hypothetical protein
VVAGCAGQPVGGADPAVNRRGLGGRQLQPQPVGLDQWQPGQGVASMPLLLACRDRKRRGSAALALDTRQTRCPRAAKNTATGNHAGPVRRANRVRTTVPRNHDQRDGDLLDRDVTAPAPNRGARSGHLTTRPLHDRQEQKRAVTASPGGPARCRRCAAIQE